jgi:hypothetical protein
MEPFTLAQLAATAAVALFKKADEKLGDASAGSLISALKKIHPHHGEADKALVELEKAPGNTHLETQHLKSAMDKDKALRPQLERWLHEVEEDRKGGAPVVMNATASNGATVVQLGPDSQNNQVQINTGGRKLTDG